MKVTVVLGRGRRVIKGVIKLKDSATVSDLQDSIHARMSYPTFATRNIAETVILNPKKNLTEYCDGNANSLIVVFKDLGMQVSYSTLFFWEYFGPLIIYAIFYYFPVYKYFGYKRANMSFIQCRPMPCTIAAFTTSSVSWRRSLSTDSALQLHLSNVFWNCTYYWTFGSFIAYYVNHPFYTPVSDLQMNIGFGFGLICQVSDFYCFLLLRNLRSTDGSGGYQIPHGLLVDIVTFANYTTEVYQWLGSNIATQTVAGYMFLVVAALIMTNWALAKHRRLKKIFDGKEGRGDTSSISLMSNSPLDWFLLSQDPTNPSRTMSAEFRRLFCCKQLYLFQSPKKLNKHNCLWSAWYSVTLSSEVQSIV